MLVLRALQHVMLVLRALQNAMLVLRELQLLNMSKLTLLQHAIQQATMLLHDISAFLKVIRNNVIPTAPPKINVLRGLMRNTLNALKS